MPDTFPLQFLLATFAGRVKRHQAQVVDYLIEEYRVLKEFDHNVARSTIAKNRPVSGLTSKSGSTRV